MQSTHYFLFVLLLEGSKCLKSLKGFCIAYSRDNNTFFISFIYSIFFAIGFSNLFNNLIRLVIQFLFIEIQKLSDFYRQENTILLCKLFDLLFNFLLHWVLSFFNLLDKLISSQIVSFFPITRTVSSIEYSRPDSAIFNRSYWNILLPGFYTPTNYLKNIYYLQKVFIFIILCI